jgi:DNA-binding CsgD family transcriptional regulator
MGLPGGVGLNDAVHTSEVAVKDLTPREIEVLGLISEGYSTRELAGVLGISPHTVREYRMRILNRLGVHSIGHAIAIGLRQGVIA